jgi:hypothetical protein
VARQVASAGLDSGEAGQGVKSAGREAVEAAQAQAERVALEERAVRRPAERKVVRQRQTPVVVAVVRSAAQVEEVVNLGGLVWAYWSCVASISCAVDEALELTMRQASRLPPFLARFRCAGQALFFLLRRSCCSRPLSRAAAVTAQAAQADPLPGVAAVLEARLG